MNGIPGSGPPKIVYEIVERDGRKFWRRIGEAFVNRDGSLAVTFSETPVIHGRTFEVRDVRGKAAP